MKVMKVAQIPSPTVAPGASVTEAVQAMRKARGGAVGVLDGEKLVGMFSERDVMLRVVAANLDPLQTLVMDVMTQSVERAGVETDCCDALALMIKQHIRHLPVVDDADRLVGLLSIRNLLQNHVEDLDDQLNSLEAYFNADGPGG